MDARVGGAVGQQPGLPGQLQAAGEWWTDQTYPSSLTPLFLLPLATVHASVREINFSRPWISAPSRLTAVLHCSGTKQTLSRRTNIQHKLLKDTGSKLFV